MRSLKTLLLVLSTALVVPACVGDGDEALDGENESFGGPKADGFCAEEGTLEAKGILEAANTSSLEELDISVADGGAGLNRRAAENIVAERPFATLADLDAVSFVGVATCTSLKTFACEVKELCTAGPPACLEVGNKSGRDFDVSALNDPIANAVLKAPGNCPSTYEEIVEKMRQTDSEGCDGGGGDGMETMFVTERGQVTGKVESGRSVTTRSCDGRREHEVFFSLFGVSANSSRLPGNVEVMGFDSVAGVYNYYTLESGVWEFHGNSTDFIEPGASQRCAKCHTGGGPIMKELDTPWMHWEGHEDTEGAADFVDKFPDLLGFQSDGASLEFMVKDGNRAWNERRVKHQKERATVAQMLKPLFCTVEVNLDNASDFHSPTNGETGAGDDLSDIPAAFLLEPRLKSFGRVDMDAEIYKSAIEAAGQKVVDGAGRQLTDKDGGKSIDTIFDFVYPERSFADRNYVDRLVVEGIIDDEFAEDVLAIDFTRPIFSSERCGLLEFAPDLDASDRTAAVIKTEFVKMLEQARPAAGSAGDQLLKNLKDDDDDHKASVGAFLDACRARDQVDFMTDVMQTVSLVRNIARGMSVFEFAETMPVTDLEPALGTRLNPETCELDQ